MNIFFCMYMYIYINVFCWIMGGSKIYSVQRLFIMRSLLSRIGLCFPPRTTITIKITQILQLRTLVKALLVQFSFAILPHHLNAVNMLDHVLKKEKIIIWLVNDQLIKLSKECVTFQIWYLLTLSICRNSQQQQNGIMAY